MERNYAYQKHKYQIIGKDFDTLLPQCFSNEEIYNKDMADYKYLIQSVVDVSVVGDMIFFDYYTNNNDKAGLAEGDNFKMEGKIKDYYVSSVGYHPWFIIADDAQ